MRALNLIVLLLIPLLMGADYFQWTDENGVVTFSQLAPHGVEASRVYSGSHSDPSPPSEPAAVSAPADPERARLTADQRIHLERLEQMELARQQEIARIRHANCERAELLLERLQSASRLRVREENGEQRVMPETEHRERIADAQRDVALHCNPRG
jgi:hypothetical protein